MGLLLQKRGETGWTADSESRKRVEQVAMRAVMNVGNSTWGIRFVMSPPKMWLGHYQHSTAEDGRIPPARHIEVKGRAKGQSTITVTRNEIMYALNQAEKFILAVVMVDGDSHEGPYYIRNPFSKEPDWAVSSINLDLEQLLARSHRPEEKV